MITKPRGTKDSYGTIYASYREMIAIIANLFKKYNFQPFATPIFESQNLFTSSVGETSDIVTREMYRFSDRKNRLLVLRPEGTAPVVRSVIENRLYLPQFLPLKLFYYGPMFRYERPQVGRSRQFDQIGVEVFGLANLYQDLEIMRLIKDLIDVFNLNDEVVLDINYLVGDQTREAYVKALKSSCEKIGGLCDLCQIRLNKNPLRVLDCKEDQSKLKNLPHMVDYLSPEESDYWKKFQLGLDEIGLKWDINHNLVRGLDYYTGLIFELKTTNPILKSQSTFLAGGRYNRLVMNLGGPDLDAVGFAIGTDRLFELLQVTNKNIFTPPVVDFYLWAPKSNDWSQVDQIMTTLRSQNLCVATDFISRDFKRAIRKAEQVEAKNILLIRQHEGQTIIELKGETELKFNKYEMAEILEKIAAKGSN